MRNENYIAVAVGYNFGIVPNESLEGIKLNTSGAVRFRDENLTLYKAATYEESRKIDALLDRYGEYSIKEYRIEPVIMNGVIEMEIPRFDKEKDALSFGAYGFICDGKTIPVDFSGTTWDIEQQGNHLEVSFETGETPLLTDLYIDDCYLDSYREAGLNYNDITAEFLSKAESIFEFMVIAELDGEEYLPEEIHEMGKFQMKSLSFSNGENTYEISPSVIEAYNQSLDEFKENRIWITVYKDILGIVDYFDNITSICVPKDWLIKKLEKEGDTLDEWLSDYTADTTDTIAREALAEDVVLDYEKRDLKELREKETVIRTDLDKESNLEEKITAAQNRSNGINEALSESDQVWKVTFFHVTPEPEKHEFDVYIDMIPKVFHDGKRELEDDNALLVYSYEKAAEIVGKDVLSEYVIMNAAIVDKSKQNTQEIKPKEPEQEI